MNINFDKIVKLLRYAKKYINYYNNIQIDKITPNNYMDIISDIPIIEKTDIRNNYMNFISKELGDISFIFKDENIQNSNININDKNLFIETTTGTSGIPLILIKSFDERLKLGRILNKIRCNINAEAAKNMCCFLNHNNLIENIPIATNRGQPVNVKEEIEYLNDNPLYSWWHISLSRLEMYLKFLFENNITFNSKKYLKIIENNGFYMSKQIKDEIEKTFSCEVYDHYGCRETWTIAFSCKHGYHHINQENIYLELVDDLGNVIVDNNVPGHIVLTSLNQLYMPFIRYKLGDEAYYIEGTCLCGMRERRIALVPKRNFIKGTTLYGDEEFRVIIRELTQDYKFTNFKSIEVVQNNIKSFIFYIIGNRENEFLLENCISDIVRKRFSCDYELKFVYSDDSKYKGVFTCLC